MAPEVVAWDGFSGGGHVGKSTDDAAKVALQFGTNPQAIGQEGHHARQVGQQVGVNGDGELRAPLFGFG